jgi:hypothetical protein
MEKVYISSDDEESDTSLLLPDSHLRTGKYDVYYLFTFMSNYKLFKTIHCLRLGVLRIGTDVAGMVFMKVYFESQ